MYVIKRSLKDHLPTFIVTSNNNICSHDRLHLCHEESFVYYNYAKP